MISDLPAKNAGRQLGAEELLLTFPTDGEGNSTIHQHLQVGLERRLAFCCRFNERRRYEGKFSEACDVAFGESFAAGDLYERRDAA